MDGTALLQQKSVGRYQNLVGELAKCDSWDDLGRMKINDLYPIIKQIIPETKGYRAFFDEPKDEGPGYSLDVIAWALIEEIHGDEIETRVVGLITADSMGIDLADQESGFIGYYQIDNDGNLIIPYTDTTKSNNIVKSNG